MNGNDRQSIIMNESEFRGYVTAKLEIFEQNFLSLETEIKEVKLRLRGIENWKIQVSTMSALVGGIAGFILERIFK